MNDIASQEDIQLLVDSFYQKVKLDPVIGFIFTEVVPISWEEHMPVMYAFWGSILLGTSTYQANPMAKHLALDQKVTLTPEHFERWLRLWKSTVREHFSGEKAEEAISRASGIAALMQYKVEQNRPVNP